MGYQPRIESAEYTDFLTTRTRNSELWFVNNPELEPAKRYEVALYALETEGNNLQGPDKFAHHNRCAFMRDLKSAITRNVPRYTPLISGRKPLGSPPLK